MSQVFCRMCGNRFSPTPERLPKVIPCGHSCCYGCLTSRKKCPSCNINLNSINLESLPTNINFLELCNSYLTYDMNDEALKCCLEKIYNILFSVHETLIGVILNISKYDICVYTAFKKRDLLTFFNYAKPQMERIKCKFTPYPKDFLNVMHSEIPVSCFALIKEYLAKGKTIYAASYIGEKLKYGKLALKGQIILINSLVLTEKDPNSLCIYLNNLVHIFGQEICSFFTFKSKRKTTDSDTFTIFFDIVPSQRKSGFIELCTGEIKSGFRGTSYVCHKNNLLELNLNVMNCINLHCGNEKLKIKKGAVIILFVSSFRWEIKIIKTKDLTSDYRKSIVGKVIHSINFEDFNNEDPADRVIKECGIAIFEFPVNKVISNSKQINAEGIAKIDDDDCISWIEQEIRTPPKKVETAEQVNTAGIFLTNLEELLRASRSFTEEEIKKYIESEEEKKE